MGTARAYTGVGVASIATNPPFSDLENKTACIVNVSFVAFKVHQMEPFYGILIKFSRGHAPGYLHSVGSPFGDPK